MSDHTTSITFDRESRDYAITVGGAVIGFAATVGKGEAMAAAFIASQIENEAQCAAVEAEATAALIEIERAGGVAETRQDPAPVAVNPAAITRQRVAAALAEARAKVADNARWATALGKAATELEIAGWAFNGQQLVISSRSTTGRRYHVTADQCDCPAGAKGNTCCWHRAARQLLVRAAQQAA